MIDIPRELYPFAPHYLEIEGHRYHYLDEGERSQAAIVMLHGNPSWSFYYRNLIRELSPLQRVIVPDHMGMGLSDKPQHYRYTLERHIQNLDALLTQLDLKDISLVLHDWGGLIGLGYALRHVERIRRLVVFNTAGFYFDQIPLSIKIARSPGLGEFLVRGLNVFARGALYWGVEHHERITPAVRRGYLAPYDNWHNRVAIYRFVRDIPLEPEHETLDLIMQIDAGIRVFSRNPMLIVWGERDPVFTGEGWLSEWKRRFPHAQAVSFQDAGHYVLEDAPERILPLVKRFFVAGEERA